MNINKQKLKEICKDYKLSLVILFGSQKNGSSRKGSDLDLAVWVERKDIDVDYEIDLLEAFVNLVRKDRIDIVILNYADSLLQFEVASKGSVLYEKYRGKFNEFQVYAMKRNNESHKFYALSEVYLNNFLRGVRSNVKQKCYSPKVGKNGRVYWRA